MGLVRMYRATDNIQYLNLAKFLLDVRGPDGDKGAGRTYNQSQVPPIEQTEAVGHAVRAAYMYSGMADVAALTGDTSYLKAVDAIWNDVVNKKLYITGGIGASGSGEAFGGPYVLPNMTVYPARHAPPSATTSGTSDCFCCTPTRSSWITPRSSNSTASKWRTRPSRPRPRRRPSGPRRSACACRRTSPVFTVCPVHITWSSAERVIAVEPGDVEPLLKAGYARAA